MSRTHASGRHMHQPSIHEFIFPIVRGVIQALDCRFALADRWRTSFGDGCFIQYSVLVSSCSGKCRVLSQVRLFPDEEPLQESAECEDRREYEDLPP